MSRGAGEQPSLSYVDPMPDTGGRVMRELRRASVIGLCASLGIHMLLLAVMAFTMVQGGGGQLGNGTGDGDGKPIEMAVVTETELASMNVGELNTMSPGVEDKGNVDLPNMPVVDMPGGSALPDAGELGASGSGLGGAGTGTGIGVGPGQGGAGGGSTKFFGVEAQGLRFAFIVDSSGSMGDLGKLALLKRQLKNALDGMIDGSQFIIVAFNSERHPLFGRERWTEVNAGAKKSTYNAIDMMNANGGTEPFSSFELVFQMRPRPDAIYFMTDGIFDPSIADDILRLNGVKDGAKARVPIHCITLMDRSGERVMRMIAERTGGTYKHVDGVKP